MSKKFEYKYSAPTPEERKEIESIRNQYLPKDEKTAKLERIKYLDLKVKNTPTIVSVSLGIIGILFFGAGMSFVLELVNLWYLSIPLFIIGIGLMSLAYPIYVKYHNRLKNKYSDEIISLANELINDSNKEGV